jgi:5-methylcytosine-specific restriction enzyme subunit McrC
MLLYPVTDHNLDERFCIDGHLLRIATVDLAEPWEAIDAKLRKLISNTMS